MCTNIRLKSLNQKASAPWTNARIQQIELILKASKAPDKLYKKFRTTTTTSMPLFRIGSCWHWYPIAELLGSRIQTIICRKPNVQIAIAGAPPQFSSETTGRKDRQSRPPAGRSAGRPTDNCIRAHRPPPLTFTGVFIFYGRTQHDYANVTCSSTECGRCIVH